MYQLINIKKILDQRLAEFGCPSKILFCSDLHMGHDKEFLYEKRGFKSIKEHDDWIRERWHAVVEEGDIVIDLGDVVFNDGKAIGATEISHWPGEHWVLWGNHNSGIKQIYQKQLAHFTIKNDIDLFPMSTEHVEMYPLKVNNMIFLGNQIMLQFSKKKYIFCSHFPHAIWDGMSGNSRLNPVVHLCGHSHGSYKNSHSTGKFGKLLDVGIENTLYYHNDLFFTLEDIDNIMEQKQVVILDHHTENVNYGI